MGVALFLFSRVLLFLAHVRCAWIYMLRARARWGRLPFVGPVHSPGSLSTARACFVCVRAWLRDLMSAAGEGVDGPRERFVLVAVCVALLCLTLFRATCFAFLGAPQDMGKLYGEPQTTAALRLGTMFHYGMVPFLGHNATEALSYYQEVR